MSSADELRRQVEQYEFENRKLKDRIAAADQTNDDLKRQIRDLKLNPPKRSYIDADDEKETTAWKEKAHNLLSLLDQLQRDMQSDLRELENETFSPSSSRIVAQNSRAYADSAKASNDSPYKNETRATAVESPFNASNVTPIRSETTVEGESRRSGRDGREGGREGREGREHKHHKHKEKEKGKESSTAAAAPAAAAAAPAAAAVSDAAATEALRAGYGALNDTAKHMHEVYRDVKRNGEEGQYKELWAGASGSVKNSAKAARKVGTTGGDKNDPEFSSAAAALTDAAAEWVTTSKALSKGIKEADASRKLSQAADAMDAAQREFSDSLRASGSNPAATQRHGQAAAGLAAAMKNVVDAAATALGI